MGRGRKILFWIICHNAVEVSGNVSLPNSRKHISGDINWIVGNVSVFEKLDGVSCGATKTAKV